MQQRKVRQALGRLAALAAALGLAACGGDSHEPQVPAAVVAVAGTAQQAVLGTAVAVAPAVKVTDAKGAAVADVPVTFAAATGGGSVTGGQAKTNADGVATVGSWVLGPTAGANTLTATVEGLPPVTFSATGVAAAAEIAKTAGDAQTGTVGTQLPVALAVKLTKAGGAPVAGTSVAFAVATGGGTLSASSATTNADGVASVQWTLGGTAGAQTVTATLAGLAPVTFTATATAGAAAKLVKSAGDAQSWRVRDTLAVAPAVKVTDAFDNPVAGVAVTFAVASGGGSLTASAATSDAAGLATGGRWILGSTLGANTVTASAAGLAPVTFSATAKDPCSVSLDYTGGTTATGVLNDLDCVLPDGSLRAGSYIDFYSTTTAARQSVSFSLVSPSDQDTYLFLHDAAGNVVAYDDDGANDGTYNSRLNVILPAGSWFLGASQWTSTSDFAYTLSSQARAESATNCEETWLLPGVTTAQEVQASDCNWYDGTDRNDYFSMMVKTGQTVTIRAAASAITPVLDVYTSVTGDVFEVTATGGEAVVTFTSTEDQEIEIDVRGESGGLGAYTLSVQ